MSWFLKHRPRQISDLDLKDVRQHFLKLMENGTFPQTLLFAGPKGTGKTSASRIIGAMLNDPANEKAVQSIFFNKKKSKNISLKEPNPELEFSQRVFRGQSFVVQEIDAASYRGIDDIRRLKERIFLPPQEGIMAVYILDEAHMLTNEAFNALLKILEEPPAHVVFILATTALHKVPATIVSRCNLVLFHKASLEEIVRSLKKVLKQEKIKFKQEALLEIAQRSDGSFRDAVKLAETVASQGNITLKDVDKLIGGSALVEVKKLIDLILDKDEKGVVDFFSNLRNQNFDPDYFYQSLFNYLHQNLLGSLGAIDFQPELEQKVSQFLLNVLLEIDFNQISPIAFLPLELKILSLIQQSKQKGGSQNTNHKKIKTTRESQKAQTTTKKTKSHNAKFNPNHLKKEEGEEASLLPSVEYMTAEGSLSSSLCERWDDFIKKVEANNLTLAALLRSSQPKPGPNGVAEIRVFYRFHQEQLEQPKFRSIIEQCGESVVGGKIRFRFVLTEPKVEAELVDVPSHTKELESLAEEILM